MIDYSPHTKYTAQKIQDKVTRGAYFYSSFSIDDGIGSTTNIKKLIEQLYRYLCVIEEGFVIAGDNGLKITTDIASGFAVYHRWSYCR